jgi:hypothetical protein
LARFDESGLSIGAFCRGEAISAASLYRWRNLLSEGDDGGAGRVSPTGAAFVDLGTLDSATPARAQFDLKLELGDGLVLHLVRR